MRECGAVAIRLFKAARAIFALPSIACRMLLAEMTVRLIPKRDNLAAARAILGSTGGCKDARLQRHLCVAQHEGIEPG